MSDNVPEFDVIRELNVSPLYETSFNITGPKEFLNEEKSIFNFLTL